MQPQEVLLPKKEKKNIGKEIHICSYVSICGRKRVNLFLKEIEVRFALAAYFFLYFWKERVM